MSRDAGLPHDLTNRDTATPRDSDYDADLKLARPDLADADQGEDAADANPDDVLVTACPDAPGDRPTDVAVERRSIGSATAPLFQADAEATAGASTICFTETLPPTIGPGDEVVLGDDSRFVWSRVDDHTLLLHRPWSENVRENVAVRRAFATLQEWEDARNGDLVAENRRETGIARADGPFNAGVVIEGSTTDAAHYMALTSVTEERHLGIAGMGVVIEPTLPQHGIRIEDDYTRIAGLEVTDWSTNAENSLDGINIRGDQVFVTDVLIHDDGADDVANPDCNGITVERPGITATVINSIVYDVARAGFTIHQVDDAHLHLYHSTAHHCSTNDTSSGYGCIGVRGAPTSSITAINVSATGAVGPREDWYIYPPGEGSFDGSSNNLSSDDSAPGPNAVTGVLPDVLFVDVTQGSENFHLESGAPAIDAGADLAGIVDIDVDGDTRPEGNAFDIGADEWLP